MLFRSCEDEGKGEEEGEEQEKEEEEEAEAEAKDAKVIFECALVPAVQLLLKLQVVANTMGMAAVCSVPMQYIVTRGQGVKTFSLVARECSKLNTVIPYVRQRPFLPPCAEAEALVVGCSALRACGPGFIDELEAAVGKPVVTSTQAFLWRMLRLAGVDDRIDGYGTLFFKH